jgi:hypothetical protein
MARSSAITINLSGLAGLREGLAGLRPSAQSRILGGAMEKAAKPIVSLAKAKAPKDTGALRASLGSVVRRYPEKGQILGLVGALRGYYKPGKRGVRKLRKGESPKGAAAPANYSHLVENGHRMATATGTSGRANKGKSFRKGTLTETGYVLPRPFLAPAAAQGQAAADAALGDGFGAAIEAEFKRAQRKFDKANQQ